MNTGRERTTGRIVTATAAAKTPNRQFACPICAASLIYHPVSHYRIAFFGHRPHQAEPDCPLYFAPHDTDVERVVNDRAYRIREPALRLQLLNRQGNGHRWQACVLIPKFERATSFTLENSTLYVRVQVSAIREGGNPFPVTVQTKDYVVTTFEPDEPPERITVDGFSSVTLFRLSSHLCSRVEGRAPLTPGEAYVVIHPIPANPAPPLGLLQTQPLIATDGWSGFAFALPSSPTNEITEWVTAKLDRRIAEQDFGVSVVAPIDSYKLNDGTWIVTAPTEAITASIVFGSDDAPPSALVVVHNTAGKSESLSLGSTRHTHLQIPKPHSGLYQVKRADNGVILLTVAVTAPAREPRQAGIYFLFSVNGRVEKEYLWSAELTTRFQGMSIGLVGLVEVFIPLGVRLSISTGTGAKQQRTTIDSGESVTQGESAGTALKRAIELAFKSPRPVFEIDAGGFGKLTFPPRPPERLQGPVKLPAALAARQAWVTLARSARLRRDLQHWDDTPSRLRAHARQLADRAGGTRT